MNTARIVLLIGAGCTISDVTKRPLRRRPPLDKYFFSIANKTNPSAVEKIANYVCSNYGIRICEETNDSVEKVMTMLYTDIFDPHLQETAVPVFQELIKLYNKRLADTTNDLPATNRRYLYRIICHYLQKGIEPQEISVITFNQDIQIEKILLKIQQTKCYGGNNTIFNFPYCYRIQIDERNITSPGGSSSNTFDIGSNDKPIGIEILKLHGSLNWYSVHRRKDPPPNVMFNPERVIKITRRKTIAPRMHYRGTYKRQNTLPIIVPPVTHKSAILHNSLKPLWVHAENRLKSAAIIIVFGYSCPIIDFESCNLIRRSLIIGNYSEFSIIDPDSNVLIRYINLTNPHVLTYYPTASAFLERYYD